jgi:hypothetical protein
MTRSPESRFITSVPHEDEIDIKVRNTLHTLPSTPSIQTPLSKEKLLPMKNNASKMLKTGKYNLNLATQKSYYE